MNIPKAIEILTESVYHGSTTFAQDFRDAERLGIEALKVVNEYYSYLEQEGVVPLPGETED